MASLVAQAVKHLPTMRETRVRSLGQEVPLEKEMATHSSILAWKIPWMEEPGRLQSMGLQRVGHNWATSLHFTLYIYTYTHTHYILLSFHPLMGTCGVSISILSTMCAQLESCPAQCHPMACSPPGSSAHELVQARVLEWDRGLPGMELVPGASPASAGRLFTPGKPFHISAIANKAEMNTVVQDHLCDPVCISCR